MYKKYSINEEFFKEINAKSAYVLGWIITDGCIQFVPKKRYSIRFELKDYDILETIKELIGSDAPIRKREDKNLNLLILNSKQLIKQLLALGITPAKTGKEKFIDCGEFNRDFIRGVLDGDGSVFILKKRITEQLVSYICSSNRKFLEDIGEILRQEINLIPKIYEEKPRGNSFYKLRYGAKESAALYYYLYYDNCDCLKRKRDVFEEGIKTNAGLGIAKCKECGCQIVRVSNRQKYCKECLKKIIKERDRKRNRIRNKKDIVISEFNPSTTTCGTPNKIG